MRKTGASVERSGNNVIATAGQGPSILLNSHLDTVPAQEAWTRDPWEWAQEGERIYGLGSNDAKASVACMMIAFDSIVKRGGPVQATLLLVPEEETGGWGHAGHLAGTIDPRFGPPGCGDRRAYGFGRGHCPKGSVDLGADRPGRTLAIAPTPTH